MVILNRAGRAFILSQGGLPGFLNTHHDNMESLLFNELKLGHSINCTFNNHSEDDLRKLQNELAAYETLKEKLAVLRSANP